MIVRASPVQAARPAWVGLAVTLAAACTTHQPLVRVEEEPFVLSPGPSPSQRDAVARAEGLSVAGGSTRIDLVGPNRRVPLVHASVAGRPSLLLVDSGAYDMVLYGWFAHELQDGEASGKHATVLDHANRRVDVEQWSSLQFAIDGWSPLPAVHPVVLDDSQNRGPRALGIGGILSPQRLAGAALTLDFPAGEMAELDDASAESRLASHPTSLGVAVRCSSTYVIAGTIEGKPTHLLVDTGAFTTDLRASSVAGRALAGRSSVSREIYTVGGPVETRALGDATVKVGQLSQKLDVPLVSDRARPSACGSDGVLGMDVLAQCVLVIDASKMRISCN